MLLRSKLFFFCLRLPIHPLLEGAEPNHMLGVIKVQCIKRSDLRIGKITIQIIFGDLDLDLDQILKTLEWSDLLEKISKITLRSLLSCVIAMRLAISLTLKIKNLKKTAPKDNFLDVTSQKFIKLKKFTFLNHFPPDLFRYWLKIDTDNYLKLKPPLEITQLSVHQDHDLDHDLKIIFSGQIRI